MIKLSFEPNTAMYQRFEVKFGYTSLDANESYLGISTADFRRNPNRLYAAARFDEIVSTNFRTYIRHFLEINPSTRLVTTAYGNTFNRNWQKLHDLRAPNTNLSVALGSAAGLAVLRGEAAGTLRLRNNNRTYYTYGIESNLTHTTEVGTTKHKIEVGARYNYDQIRRKQWDEEFTQDGAGALTAVAVGAPGTAGNRLQQTRALALHVQDAMKWEKFTFTPGVRFEYISQSYEQFAPETVDSGSRDFGVVVGGGSLKYDLYDSGGQDIDLFTGIHRGFSPPGPRSGIRNGIREETSVGYEAGTRYKNAPKAFATEAVFFLTNISDLVVNDSIGGVGNGETFNGGKVRTLGVEFQANYDHGLARNWAVQTPAYVAFTYTAATFQTDVSSADAESIFAGAQKGNKVPYISDVVVSFGWGLIYRKFSINFDANYTAETFADGSNRGLNINPVSGVPNERFGNIDAQFVLDVALGYQINDKVRLFSNFKNITQAEYIVTRQPHGPRPGLPFAVFAGLEFRL